ncbi:c-type cytochrome [Sulfuriflexus sp.]|uniref:c-type cytochrome n=1 Tax=Sulfuriflexus sp. TaxID=2015443 RepID=UPI0028CC6EB9|nr:c-type cytochrome [Sulfuriflexus sp.]MDT8404294.1 c-type cytochrome [Sulfuriflexus sp.]
MSGYVKTQLARILLLGGSLLLAMTASAAPNGEALYDQHCASCHGYDGHGGMGIPLALPAFLQSVPNEYLIKTIRYGREGRVMPPFKYLSDAQIDAIVKHVRGFSSAEGAPLTLGSVQGEPKNGARLYTKYCATCHGANGEGGKGTGVTFSRPRDLPVIAPALNNRGFLAAASDKMIKQTLMKGREGTPMQSFLKQGLSESDINDIVSHVRSFEGQTRKSASPEKQDISPVLVRESSYDLKTTIENVKAAAAAANYRLIRVQELDKGMVKEGKESQKEMVIYFCNFELLNNVLALDPRVGIFLPCRVTVVEREGKVQVMSINPQHMSALYNNAELDKACDEMTAIYENILEEATL